MQEKLKKAKESIKTKPSQPSGFHIEIERVSEGMSITASGVISVLEFEKSIATLKLRRGKIKILGERLEIMVYENRSVEIRGLVQGIEFYGKA